ncbi:MAG: hypothetical protein WD673_15260 [Alphaproteobacteria bacterium]
MTRERIDWTASDFAVGCDGVPYPSLPDGAAARLSARARIDNRRAEFEASGNPINLWRALIVCQAHNLRVAPWLRAALADAGRLIVQGERAKALRAVGLGGRRGPSALARHAADGERLGLAAQEDWARNREGRTAAPSRTVRRAYKKFKDS